MELSVFIIWCVNQQRFCLIMVLRHAVNNVLLPSVDKISGIQSVWQVSTKRYTQADICGGDVVQNEFEKFLIG